MNALSLLLASSAALSTASPTAAPQQGTVQELVVLYGAGLDALLVDPKDAGLLRALHQLPARLEELPEELELGMPVPEDAHPLLERLMFGPAALRAGNAPEAASPYFPFFVQLELSGGEEASKQLAQSFGRLLAELGMAQASADERGMVPLESSVPSCYGAFRDAFVLSIGELVDAPLELGSTGLPPGVAPQAYARVDIGGLIELMEESGASQDPELAPLIGWVDVLGLAGAEMRLTLGADEQRAYSMVHMPGVVSEMRASGMLPEQPISARALAAVPRDASWASLGVNNLRGVLASLRPLMALEFEQMGLGEDPLESLSVLTGVDLERDVIDALGASLGVYASDTTGGGGWLSTTAFVELGDSERVAQSVARLEAYLNGLGDEQAEGYVQIRRRERDGVTWSSLTFPGLPVPFEPTWTTAEGFFFVGATPQACEAALAHVRSGAAGLLDDPRCVEQLAGAPDALYQLGFLDTPRFLGEGYGLASLGCSALVNATRSQSDPERDAGGVLPPYAELARGARVWVRATRIEGDDLIEESRFDRSWLVNGTAVAGFIGSSPLLFVLPLAASAAWFGQSTFGPAYEPDWEEIEAFEEIEEPADTALLVEVGLLELHYAVSEFAVLNGGEYPSRLELLVTPDENGATFLGSRELPLDPWGNPYLYTPPASSGGLPLIVSLGADGLEGGELEDADIDNLSVLERARREAAGEEDD